MNPMEQVALSAQRISGLEKKKVEYQMELDDVEAKIEQVKQLQTMVSGFETSKALLGNIDGGETAAESVETAIAAIHVLEKEQGLVQLLERRRQLKQLIVTGKMDVDATSDVGQE